MAGVSCYYKNYKEYILCTHDELFINFSKFKVR